MKKHIRILCMICMLFTFSIIPAYADNMDGADLVPPSDESAKEPKYDEMYTDCLVDDYECIGKHIEGMGAGTPEDFKQAIRSFDPDVAAYETEKNYLNNFTNSTMTAMTESLSLLKPHTIVMNIMNVLITILETIGGMFSLLALIAYNFVSGSTIETLISGVLDQVAGVIFNWGDLHSWIYNVLFLVALISLVRKVSAMISRNAGAVTTKSIVHSIFETILSVCMVIFIGLYGRPIIHYVESIAEQSIVTSFTFGETGDQPIDVSMKEKIFDIMQLKPFMMRHFGTSNISSLPIGEDTEYDNLTDYNVGRVQKLLSDPSKENARAEKDLGNDVIIQGIGTSFAGVGISFIGNVHKAIAGVIILIFTLMLGVIRLLKEVLLFFSIIGMIFMMMNPKHPKAYNWFFNRMMWVLLSTFATIAFTILLYAWSSILDSVTGYGFIVAIIFDILLLVMIIVCWKFRDVILEKFKTIFDAGKEILGGAFNGTLSPSGAMSIATNTWDSLHEKSENQSQDQSSNNPSTDSNTSSQDTPYNDDLADTDTNTAVNDNVDESANEDKYESAIQNDSTEISNEASEGHNELDQQAQHTEERLPVQDDDISENNNITVQKDSIAQSRQPLEDQSQDGTDQKDTLQNPQNDLHELSSQLSDEQPEVLENSETEFDDLFSDQDELADHDELSDIELNEDSLALSDSINQINNDNINDDNALEDTEYPSNHDLHESDELLDQNETEDDADIVQSSVNTSNEKDLELKKIPESRNDDIKANDELFDHEATKNHTNSTQPNKSIDKHSSSMNETNDSYENGSSKNNKGNVDDDNLKEASNNLPPLTSDVADTALLDESPTEYVSESSFDSEKDVDDDILFETEYLIDDVSETEIPEINEDV